MINNMVVTHYVKAIGFPFIITIHRMVILNSHTVQYSLP